MTQDEIISMAREAGFTDYYPERLTRFAALVAAHEREKQAEQEPVAWMAKNGEVCRHGWRKFHAREEDVDRFCTPLYAAPVSIEAAVLAEREACAKVCDDYENRLEGMRDEDYQAEIAGRQMGAARCAKAIRSRNEK